MSESRISPQKIAIIGIGCVFPDAPNAETYWRNIKEGHVAIREVPPDRWLKSRYWSADRSLPEKTYAAIGGFLRDIPFDRTLFKIPPKSLPCIDDLQKLALTASAEALRDAGLQVMPDGAGKSFDRERCAVIFGNAMGGENEDLTSMRVWFPESVAALQKTTAFQSLTPAQQATTLVELETHFKENLPPVTEDSMPGELSNCITGRVCNVFDLRGPNYTTDAACAASLAALQCAVDLLTSGQCDLALAGGADRSLDPPTFAKFSKIGALSAEHSVPFDKRANGFVMGEGVGVIVLKRLEDAARDGDRIYAVICGIGAASDGKGKGMTAPNPVGQKLAVHRAYAQAGVGIETVGLFEAHGTSTVVGDATEARVLTDMLRASGGGKTPIPVGSVKSMIGHLKSAAGIAAIIKISFALRDKVIPPSAGFINAPPGSPLLEEALRVPTRLEPWPTQSVRRAGVSAFGFGGTNFHVVLEEAPLDPAAVKRFPDAPVVPAKSTEKSSPMKLHDSATLIAELTTMFAHATGYEVSDLDPDYQLESDLGVDTVKQAEILAEIRKRYALPTNEAFKLSDTPTIRAIAAYVEKQLNDVVLKNSPSGGVACIASGGGVLDHALPPFLQIFGASDLTQLITHAKSAIETTFPSLIEDHVFDAPVRLAFVANDRADALEKIESASTKKSRILAAQGIFLQDDAPLAKRGKIAFMFPGQGSQYLGMLADLAKVYPVVAETFREADAILESVIGEKITDIVWPKSVAKEELHHFDLKLRETQFCQPAMLAADVAMMRLLAEHGVVPDIVVGHSLGEYAACVAAGVMSFGDALYAVSARGREMAGVHAQDNGKMAVVAASAERVEKILKEIPGYVIAANKNCHSQTVIAGESPAVAAAVIRFTEEKIDAREIPVSHAFHSRIVAHAVEPFKRVLQTLNIQSATLPILSNVNAEYYPEGKQAIVALLAKQLASPVEFIAKVERMFKDGARIFVEVGPKRAVAGFVSNIAAEREHAVIATNHPREGGVLSFRKALAALASHGVAVGPRFRGDDVFVGAVREPPSYPVVSGISVILPSLDPIPNIHDDATLRLLDGENFIVTPNTQNQEAILEKNVVRLNKANGNFEPLRELADVLHLAAKIGEFDLGAMYGVDATIVDSLDATGRLCIAAGIDALRDAGLPLVQHYRTTSTGKQLPDRFALPLCEGKRTGVILGSAFPGIEQVIDDVSHHVADKFAASSSDDVRSMIAQLEQCVSDPSERATVARLMGDCADQLRNRAEAFTFSRKFLFRVMAMGHAQLAQFIGAQGPNTQINSACASGTQALGIACDWIKTGRCDRVVVISADDVTSNKAFPWIGTGFLAAGAATTETDVTQAALPFGANRNGMIVGAGASAFIVEKSDLPQERGMIPYVSIISSYFGNSAYHGTRLNSDHITRVMTEFVSDVASSLDTTPALLAERSYFLSHETYTPARGGSSASEVDAIRAAFGEGVTKLTIANTKGYTGHPMGATFEDVVAMKGLQHQRLPAIANLRHVDPDFSDLKFSDGSDLSGDIAFRFAAGFGSQIAMIAYKRIATTQGRIEDANMYQLWLDRVSCIKSACVELNHRALRVAEHGVCSILELGVPSLALSVVIPANSIVIPAKAGTHDAVGAHDEASILREVVEIFARETGYEISDLEPDYQLESDLGIDTVKQAEIFAMLREKYGFGKEESFSLGDMQTLRAIAHVMATRTNSTKVSTQAPSTASPVAKEASVGGMTVRAVQTWNVQIPHEDLYALKGRRILLAALEGINTAFMEKTLQFAGAMCSAIVLDAHAEQRLVALLAEAPMDDVIILAGSCADPEIISDRIFKVLKHVAFSKIPGLLTLVSDEDPHAAMLAGTLSGMVKAAAREWPNSRCLAVYAHQTWEPKNIIQVWQSNDRPNELVLNADGVMQALGRGEIISLKRIGLVRNAVVIATGGARGVTFRILKELAARGPLRIVILARTSGQSSNESPLAGLTDIERKNKAKASLEESGERATPLAVQQWLGKHEARVEVWNNIKSLEALGSSVELVVCDVAELAQIKKACREILTRYAHVDVVLHGAGLEESKYLVDKDPDAFLRTYRPKASAAHVLLDILTPARFISMGSVAGRFGNPGQVDYSAANNAISYLARVRTDVLNIAWTAWADVGMATRGSVAKVLDSLGVQLMPVEIGERFGADLVASAITGEVVVAGKLGALEAQEITSHQELSEQPKPAMVFNDVMAEIQTLFAQETGYAIDDLEPDYQLEADLGIDTVKQAEIFSILRDRYNLAKEETFNLSEVQTLRALAAYVIERAQKTPGGAHIPFDRIEHVGDALGDSFVFHVILDPKEEPGLDHHRIEGVSVLPGVLGIELMVRAAEIFSKKSATHAKDIHFTSPLKMFHDKKTAIQVAATSVGDGVHVVLSSVFVNPKGKEILREHFDAWVGFSEQPVSSPRKRGPMRLREPIDIPASTIYQHYFHGPAFQVLEGTSQPLGKSVMGMTVQHPALWLRAIEPASTRSAPFVRESGFQTAGIWEMAKLGRMSLPLGIDEIIFSRHGDAGGRVQIIVNAISNNAEGAQFDIIAVADDGTVMDSMKGYRTAVLTQSLGDLLASPNIEDVEVYEGGVISEWLCAQEQVVFSSLKSEKRRREWFAGRMAAKRLVKRLLQCDAAYADIVLKPDELGAPHIYINDVLHDARISISHSGGLALACLSTDPGIAPGIDAEVIEARLPSFAETYFSEEERANAETFVDLDTGITSFWAIKEAVLKALGIGARVDMRELSVSYKNEIFDVAFSGEAQKYVANIQAGELTVDVRFTSNLVVAMVMMPVAEHTTMQKFKALEIRP